jgi:hypothetical protein
MVAINLLGTTQDSQVTISALFTHPRSSIKRLNIAHINVRTGHVGSIQGLTTADLMGRISPLRGPVSSLQFDSIGPAAQIDVTGNLGQLTVNQGVNLGPGGHVNVTNDATGSVSISGDLTLDGGQIHIGRDLTGSVAIGGSLTVTNNGQFSVGRNLGGSVAGTSSTSGTGGISVAGNLSVDSNGELSVGGNSSALAVGGNLEASGGGGIVVAGNLGSITLSGGGSGGASATGNVILNSGGQITVDRNLGTLSVGNNLQTSGGGHIHVLGNMGVLSVSGIVRGKGSGDVTVGDDLGQLTVLGGGSNVFSLQGVNIDVSKNIQGVDVRNGITGSLITAGILIDGGAPGAGSNGWSIGPDGTVAVFDSQILAGSEIRNITIGGDVESDLPGNPVSGRVTRIVAGEDKNGNFSASGIIDNFQIVGRLVNAVLAASVQPYGGTGAEPPTPTPPNYNPPTSTSDDNGYKTYDEPAGAITVGSVTYLTYTAPPYDPNSDPTIDDLVLPGGAINPSFAPARSGSPALPSKSTVLGGVVSTAHGDEADFAGIFAANTNGVFVGPLPTS